MLSTSPGPGLHQVRDTPGPTAGGHEACCETSVVLTSYSRKQWGCESARGRVAGKGFWLQEVHRGPSAPADHTQIPPGPRDLTPLPAQVLQGRSRVTDKHILGDSLFSGWMGCHSARCLLAVKSVQAVSPGVGGSSFVLSYGVQLRHLMFAVCAGRGAVLWGTGRGFLLYLESEGGGRTGVREDKEVLLGLP